MVIILYYIVELQSSTPTKKFVCLSVVSHSETSPVDLNSQSISLRKKKKGTIMEGGSDSVAAVASV